MSTPSYLGAGQPGSGNGSGWLARLGSYFGSGATPAYSGNGQPSPVASGSLLKGTTPVYAAVPAVKPAEPQVSSPAQAEGEAVAMTCPIDPAALAAGHIAIVIPDFREP